MIRQTSIGDVTRESLAGRAACRIDRSARRAAGRENATILDVGTGLADIPARVAKDPPDVRSDHQRRRNSVAAGRRRIAHEPVSAPTPACRFAIASTSSSARRCSITENPDAERLVREMNAWRVAVIISDLRRSWIAAAAFWLVSFPMRFHRVTRHDGTVSVLRGFTPAELRDIIRSATGVVPRVRRRLGYRLTARWSPTGAA
jgi:hypothetical protein